MQTQQETLLQGQLASLQDRIGVEEQAAIHQERQACQKVIADTIKQRDGTHQTAMTQRVGLCQQQL
eukprot:9153231-Prorocentrum_lima.AAC.1